MGVAADFLASFFVELLPLLPGTNKGERLRSLWHEIESFYDAHDVKDRMPKLTEGGLQQKKEYPKLKAQAACVRKLVPLAPELSAKYLDVK